MPAGSDTKPIAIVTACMNQDGTPTFALTEVVVTAEEAENGVHYYLAEVELGQRGFEEPYVHFGANEAPGFLHEAVRELFGLPPAVSVPIFVTCPEDSQCLASLK